MKIVINECFGGFRIKKDILKEIGGSSTNVRTNKKLIHLIESGVDCSGACARLIVVEIPDQATDYYINDYGGAESVLYVLDGKIHIL